MLLKPPARSKLNRCWLTTVWPSEEFADIVIRKTRNTSGSHSVGSTVVLVIPSVITPESAPKEGVPRSESEGRQCCPCLREMLAARSSDFGTSSAELSLVSFSALLGVREGSTGAPTASPFSMERSFSRRSASTTRSGAPCRGARRLESAHRHACMHACECVCGDSLTPCLSVSLSPLSV